jgi:NTE family protein
MQDSLPADYDALVDRRNDLTYHDRTMFDERMAIMLSDSVNLAKNLIKLAEDNGISRTLIDRVLDQQAETRDLFGKRGKY